MKSYKKLLDYKIIDIFYKCIEKVNHGKSYCPNSLTKEERFEVKKLLSKKLGLNDEQSDFLL